MGFKYQKADDWLDSKFYCSNLESKGVPEKTAGNTGIGKKAREIISLSFPAPVHDFRFWLRHFRLVTSRDVTAPLLFR